jgi:hypothetical protein
MIFVFSILKAVVIMIMMIIVLVMITTTTPPPPLIMIIIKGCSLIGQTLNLLPINHQFEYHKPQGRWRLTWLLTF